MTMTLREKIDRLYEAEKQRLERKREKAIENFDPAKYGWNEKEERISEEIKDLEKEYSAIKDVYVVSYELKKEHDRNSQMSFAIAELFGALGQYDLEKVDIIKRKYNI